MHRDAYEHWLAVPSEIVPKAPHGFTPTPWLDYFLNPRLLRGSDFLMRWSQGVWSERRLIEAVQATSRWYAIPYGPSGVAPDNPRDVELYFERLEAAGLDGNKRPDLLVFENSTQQETDRLLHEIGGVQELPFNREDRREVRDLLDLAVIALECENSLWRADLMPHYSEPLRPMKRLGGKLGLPANSVLPTIIIKDEDFGRLRSWERSQRIPIHVWHAFYERAFGIALEEAHRLIEEGFVLPYKQRFQAPGGAVTTKSIFRIYYHHGYSVAQSKEEPQLEAKFIMDKNGHILPYVAFAGGSIKLMPDALRVLSDASSHKKARHED